MYRYVCMVLLCCVYIYIYIYMYWLFEDGSRVTCFVALAQIFKQKEIWPRMSVGVDFEC